MFVELTPEEKYYCLYLISNPHVQKCGCYLLPSRIAGAESGYNNETTDKLQERLREAGWIYTDTATREILVRMWPELNPGFFAHGSKVRSAIVKEAKKIRSDRLRNIVFSWLSLDSDPTGQSDYNNKSSIDASYMGDACPIDGALMPPYNTQTRHGTVLHNNNIPPHGTQEVVAFELLSLVPEPERSPKIKEVILQALESDGSVETVRSNIEYALRHHVPARHDGKPQSLGGFILSAVTNDFARADRQKAAVEIKTRAERDQMESDQQEAQAAEEAAGKQKRAEALAVWRKLPPESRVQMEALALMQWPVLKDVQHPELLEKTLAARYAEGSLSGLFLARM